ncbi:MAG: winged helix-turn-helix domain-containing protein, partial [Acidobacteriota bacterium]
FDFPSTAEREQGIPDKAMAVLLILAEQPRKVCTREHLLDAVWGLDREAYDRVLDNAISELRKAFGDNPRSPRYIETITKKGYRLIAEVEWPGQPASPIAGAEEDASADPSSSQRESVASRLENVGRVSGRSGLGVPLSAPALETATSPAATDSERPDDAASAELDAPADAPGYPVGIDGARGSKGTRALAAEREAPAALGQPPEPSVPPSSGLGASSWRARLGVFGALFGLLLVAGLWSLFFPSSSLPLHIAPSVNRTARPLYDGLEARLAVALEKHQGPRSRVGFRDLSFISNGVIKTVVEERDGRLVLTAWVDGVEGLDRGPFEVVSDGKAQIDPLVERLANEIHGRLDRHLCQTGSGSRGQVPEHCLRAGNRDWIEGLLGPAEERLKLAADKAQDAETQAQAWDLLTVVYAERGETRPAHEALSSSMASAAPSPAEEARRDLRTARIEGDARGERQALERLEREDPSEARWHARLGLTLWRDHRACSESLASFEQANQRIGSAMTADLPSIGRALVACGQDQKALAALERMAQLWAGNPRVLAEKATVERLLGLYDAAQETLQRASPNGLEHPELIRARAELYLAKGLLKRAGGDFDSVKKYESWPRGVHDARLGSVRALLRAEGGAALERARALAGEALAAVPASLEARYFLGVAVARSGSLDEARRLAEELAERARETGSRRAELLRHRLLGEIARAENVPEEAVGSFESALDHSPLERAEVLYELAEALGAAGLDSRAARVLEEILERQPHHPRALCTAGQWREEAGDPAAARSLYRRAFEHASDTSKDRVLEACLRRWAALRRSG